MPQFRSPLNLPLVEPTPARLVTPLGSLRLQALADGAEGEPFEQFGDGLPCLRRYRLGHLMAQLLLFPLDPPPLPDGMRVDSIVAAVWRVQAHRDAPPTTFRAMLERTARIKGGNYRCDARTIPFVWDAPGVRLSVVTLDAGALAAAAEKGALISARLARAFAEDWRLVPRAIGERDGLEANLPSLKEGESAQVQFLVVWRTGEFEKWDESTWYAGDVSSEHVAAAADEALGPTA